MSQETGVSPSCLNRMARGRWPDGAGLAALSAWAGLNPADFVEQHFSRATELVQLAEVSALLRMDSCLTVDAANALEEIIRIAYAAFQRNDP